jgi:urate oxidase
MKIIKLSVVNYIFDNTRYTTLKETNDRIFSTSVSCKWKFGKVNPNFNFNGAYDSVKRAIFGIYIN